MHPPPTASHAGDPLSGRGALLGHVGQRFSEGSAPTLLPSGSYISGGYVGPNGGATLPALATRAGTLSLNGTSPLWIVSVMDGPYLKMVMVNIDVDLLSGKGYVKAIDARCSLSCGTR